jgi:hypothetical protein
MCGFPSSSSNPNSPWPCKALVNYFHPGRRRVIREPCIYLKCGQSLIAFMKQVFRAMRRATFDTMAAPQECFQTELSSTSSSLLKRELQSSQIVSFRRLYPRKFPRPRGK